MEGGKAGEMDVLQTSDATVDATHIFQDQNDQLLYIRYSILYSIATVQLRPYHSCVPSRRAKPKVLG